jgi:hypothetical protein
VAAVVAVGCCVSSFGLVACLLSHFSPPSSTCTVYFGFGHGNVNGTGIVIVALLFW